MSKIVCEVCGAAYPETSSRCPVCGSVHYGTPDPVATTTVTPRKERTEARSGGENRQTNTQRRRKQSKKNNPMVKYIAIGVALLVVLAILAGMLMSSCEGNNSPTEPSSTTEPPETTLPEKPCTGITLSVQSVNLTEIGQSVRLTAICTPEDTTDVITFTTSDPAIVTVDEVGQIVAIGPGSAQITVVCGTASAVCEVSCTIIEETEPPTLPPETLVLNRADFTLAYKGATWQLYSGQIDKSLITFTSANEDIATFIDGKVTAIGGGTTTVYAEYGDQKVSCIVRCAFRNDTTSEGNGGVEEDNGNTEDTENPGSDSYTLMNSYGPDLYRDATIKVGESLEIYLKDSANNKITLEWTVSAEGYVTVESGVITGTAPGRVYLKATYEGVEYKYVIRIAPATT